MIFLLRKNIKMTIRDISHGSLVSNVMLHVIQESLTVWDKARGAGGRMSTSRSTGNPQEQITFITNFF